MILSLSNTTATRKARHVKFRISPSCIHEMASDPIFRKRKKNYLQSFVQCRLLTLHQIILQRQMTYS